MSSLARGERITSAVRTQSSRCRLPRLLDRVSEEICGASDQARLHHGHHRAMARTSPRRRRRKR
jgi:hypothetical protein